MSATDSAAAAVRLADTERALGISEYPVAQLPYRDLVMAALGLATTAVKRA
ncbi:hypothetical protein [Nocardia sp. NPDC057227]|uniref:hypothetical protein n=1 Tax=Nocardia sp. NPDC057227 TaxID=3346056 RepID=UPI0036458CD7